MTPIRNTFFSSIDILIRARDMPWLREMFGMISGIK